MSTSFEPSASNKLRMVSFFFFFFLFFLKQNLREGVGASSKRLCTISAVSSICSLFFSLPLSFFLPSLCFWLCEEVRLPPARISGLMSSSSYNNNKSAAFELRCVNSHLPRQLRLHSPLNSSVLPKSYRLLHELPARVELSNVFVNLERWKKGGLTLAGAKPLGSKWKRLCTPNSSAWSFAFVARSYPWYIRGSRVPLLSCRALCCFCTVILQQISEKLAALGEKKYDENLPWRS